MAPVIRESIMTKRMPPGQIDNYYLHRFKSVNHLTTTEETFLIHWINAGTPKDDGEDPLSKPLKPIPEWTLGKPDMILYVPRQEIPATGVLPYRHIPIDVELDEDKWIKGYEFKPSNRSVVHHIIASTLKKQGGGRRGTMLGAYVPGKEPITYHDAGFLLGKDEDFIMEMHYTTNGKATSDSTQLGLYFHDSPPKRLVRVGTNMNTSFVIPPHAKDHKVSAKVEIKRDTYLYYVFPHMHYRGSRMDYTLKFPDGSSDKIISVPNYRFNWQMDYTLKEPIFLPAGTVIASDGAFDNSRMNKYNPDPDAEVRWGQQSWEEMFIGFFWTATDR